MTDVSATASVTTEAAPAKPPPEYVELMFLGFCIVIVLGDTAGLFWLAMCGFQLNEAVLAILASFLTATAISPLAAWVGYRYGASKTKAG
jgi:hypothetical protein